MPFHESGQILDDRKLGYAEAVSQFDEGSSGSTKDLFSMVATPLAVTFEQHHGKTIDVGIVSAVINLPNASSSIKGMKLSVRPSMDIGTNPSMTINAYNSAGALATIFRGSLVISSGTSALGTGKSALAFNSIDQYETMIDLEFDGTNWIASGKTVGALV